MNVLQVLPMLDVGGVETGTVDLARYLAAHGHKAVVVSGGGRMVKDLEAAKAVHYTLPVGRKSVLSMLKMVRSLVKVIRREDVDVIHARSRVPAISAYFAAHITGKVFVTTAHGYYKKHIMSEAMGWGRFVIVASNAMARHMSDDFHVPNDRIRLIPRGVDLSRFSFRGPDTHYREEFTIGMVSRITPLKGHDDFIKAVNLLARQIPRLKAVIVGEAPKAKYREDIELLIRRLGLAKTVVLAGACADIPQVMAGFDVLVSATTTPEAFGRSIVEAQAIGVPVVATRVGGVVDIIEDGKTGLLCQPGDPRDIADKVFRLYKDEQLRKELARSGRAGVEGKYELSQMAQRTISVYEEAVLSLNILVIKLSALGDVILSVPSLRSIRATFPHAKIAVLVGLGSREVLDKCPYINETIVYDDRGKDRGLMGLWGLSRILRRGCYDMSIDLQNNRKSHLLAFLALIPSRYGYKNGKASFLLNKGLIDDAPFMGPVEHQGRVLSRAGISCHDRSLELWPSDEDKLKASQMLSRSWVKEDQPVVGVHIRASDRWLTKNWPIQSLAQLIDRLASEHNVRTVMTGSAADIPFAEMIMSSTSAKAINLVGKTSLLELAAVIKRCAVFIAPDTAPLHIAAAMKTPYVGLFGPTDPRRHIPPEAEGIIISKNIESRCPPCYGTRCQKGLRCMKKISVDDVIKAVLAFYQRGAGG